MEKDEAINEIQQKREKLDDYFKEITVKPRFCDNVPSKWKQLREELEKDIRRIRDSVNTDRPSNKDTRFIISTIINEDTREIENNIFNLQYFFLCADSIQKQYPEIEMVLIVKCLDSSDEHRVKVYLYIQAKFRKRMHIAIKHISKSAMTNEKSLSCAREYKQYTYPEMETQEMGKSIGRMLPLVSVSMENHEGRILYSDLVEMGGTWLQETIKKIEDNQELSWGESPKDILMGISANNFLVLKDSVGKNKQLTNDEKKSMMLHLEDILISMKEMSFLSQLIWFYELRYLLEQPDLKNIAVEFWGDMEIVWEYTRWNAVAYAEGILQLLENSCQHSCGKIGYFSFRVHDVDINTTNADVLSIAERRDRVYRRFRINRQDQPLDIREKCYLEFGVIDDAFDIESQKAYGVAEKAGVEKLEELFWGEKANKKIEDIIHHYGLELFCINIVLNNGRFLFTSPAETKELGCFASFTQKDKSKKTSVIKKYNDSAGWGQEIYTHYKILVPMLSGNIGLQTTTQENKDSKNPSENYSLFDNTILNLNPSKESPYCISGKMFFPDNDEELKNMLWKCTGSQTEKMQCVDHICESLKSEVLNRELNNKVVKIDLSDYRSNQIELFAKGLFSFLAQDGALRYLLLWFGSDKSIAEFIRISSVFYNRMGVSDIIQGRQIALCSMDEETKLPNVKTVLAGECIETVNETARTYMYYNPETSHSLIAQLKYLTRKIEIKWNGHVVPLYPFDLIRDETSGSSWFLQRMSCILENDLREDNMGCKLPNAHVCLGSRIHIRDFYEAELLFHNMGNVYRFAYCIAESIVNSVDDNKLLDKPLILLGYENYSVLLVSEVVHILKTFYGEKVPIIEYMTFVRNKKGKETVVLSAELEYLQKSDVSLQGEALLEANFISILPIGSTMSTIYKLINVTTRNLYRRFSQSNKEFTRLNFLKHYSVIVVSCKNNHEEKLQDKYWKLIEQSNKLELIEEKNEEMAFRPEVEFFLMTRSDWYVPEKCPICKADLYTGQKENAMHPLGYVDKTSTVPKLIYPAYESNYKGISHFEEKVGNTDKLKGLYGCILYGHVSFLNNHFQFYIKFPQYYEKCKEGMWNKLNSWFNAQQAKIDKKGFNIVISPLSELEPSFLKDVIDYIFQHNIRFLYIPLNKEFKENVRTKFRYFAEEYKRVSKYNPQMCINVYYVDYSIVSAQTLYRGRNLINMLMDESGVDSKKSVNVYKKVFVLLNRSSYDTVNSFVENPDKDYCAYATLDIPSFNTWESSCPICEKVDLYKNLAKCSSTNNLYWHYKRLEEKHAVRTPEEYENWLNNRILFDTTIYKKTIQFFLDAELVREQKNKQVKEQYRTDSELTLAMWLQNKYLSNHNEKVNLIVKRNIYIPFILNRECLKDWVNEQNSKEITDFIQKEIIDVKNYLRLLCTHKIMELQDTFYKELFSGKGMDSKSEYMNKIQEQLMQFLYKEIVAEKNIVKIVKRELLISYIKVISRGYLAYLAPVREISYQFMSELLEQLLNNWQNKDSKFLTAENGILKEYDFSELLEIPEEKDDYWQIYQLALILLKRLCDLQSVKVLEHSFLMRWLNFAENLWMQYLNNICQDKEHIGKGEKEQFLDNVIQDYTKCLKWSVAASEDNAKGILLKNLCDNIREEKDEY